jgi:hypothetical protein
VSFGILNTGDADYSGPLAVSSYVFENGIFRKLDSRQVTVNAMQGVEVPVSYTVTNFPAGAVAASTLQVRINEEDGVFPLPECTYSGNYSQELFGAPNYAFCADETGTLYFYPQNSPHIYYWYNENPNQNPLANSFYQGDAYPFTKKANQGMERFYVKVHDGNDWLNNEIYDVNVFLVPDSLVWTGAADNSWNNPDNWNNPDGSQGSSCAECAAYQIPGACTNVEIPGKKNRYPELTSQASPPTVYADYLSNRIHFGFGGEVKRTDSLQYREAFIDLTLNSNQWYLFSPPLRNFYTGDFYVRTPNPFLDGNFIEPMFFEANNPQTGTRTSNARWTGSFNNPDIELGVGRGVAVWVDSIGTEYNQHFPVTFRFPKSDPFYYFYTNYGLQLNERTGDLEREKKNRFIYEDSIDAGIVTWRIPGVTAGQSILIGNPFLAHLNFEAFADSNSTQIDAQYKLAYGVAGTDGKVREFVTRMKDAGGYINTDAYGGGFDELTSYIAPMQAFIVTSRVNGTLTLRAFMKDTEVNLAQPFTLRSARESRPERTLGISAIRGNHASHALLLQRANASRNYVSSEDSHKLFLDNDSVSVMVYTRSADGYALDVNTVGELNQGVSIGIRSTQPGEIRLKFNGITDFGNNTAIYLHDMLTGLSVKLSEGSEHVFNKEDNELYLENRFFLTFSEVTGIQEMSPGSEIVIRQLSEGKVRIASDNGFPLGKLQITNIQGKVIISQEVKESFYTFRVPAPGIYLVRVSNSTGTKVRKLGIRN